MDATIEADLLVICPSIETLDVMAQSLVAIDPIATPKKLLLFQFEESKIKKKKNYLLRIHLIQRIGVEESFDNLGWTLLTDPQDHLETILNQVDPIWFESTVGTSNLRRVNEKTCFRVDRCMGGRERM